MYVGVLERQRRPGREVGSERGREDETGAEKLCEGGREGSLPRRLHKRTQLHKLTHTQSISLSPFPPQAPHIRMQIHGVCCVLFFSVFLFSLFHPPVTMVFSGYSLAHLYPVFQMMSPPQSPQAQLGLDMLARPCSPPHLLLTVLAQRLRAPMHCIVSLISFALRAAAAEARRFGGVCICLNKACVFAMDDSV